MIAKEQHVILDCESVFIGKTGLTNTFVIRDHCVETCAQCVKTQALSSTTPAWLIKASYYKTSSFFKVPNISINQGFATVFVITEQQHMLDQSITCKTQPDKWKCLQKIQRHLQKKAAPTHCFAVRLFSASSFNRDALPLLEPCNTVQLVFDCGQCQLW